VRQVSRGEEPPVTDLDAIDHAFFESEVWRAAMRVPAFESVKAVTRGLATTTTTRSTRTQSSAAPALGSFYFANGFSGHGAQRGQRLDVQSRS
jgi:hypothetical protein